MSVVSISWLFFAAVPPAVMVAVTVHAGSVAGGWWHRIPPLRSVGLVLLTFCVETLLGMLVGSAPAVAWIPIVAAGGVFNAWAWFGVVGAVTGSVSRHWVPLAPMVAIGIVTVVVAGTAIGFQANARHPTAVTLHPTVRVVRGERPILIVGGFDSQIQQAAAHPIPGPYNEVRFSYSGLTARGAPRPYPATATHQSIQVLVRLLAVQVASLRRSTGQPIDLVAESEGALLARTYLAADPGAPVADVLLLSPLDQPAGSSTRRRVIRATACLPATPSSCSPTCSAGSPRSTSPADSPFLRSIVDHGGELRDLLSCPTTPVRETLVEPLADAVADPVGPSAVVPSLVVAAFHGGLLSSAAVDKDLGELLAGRSVTSSGTLSFLERAVRLAAGAWQVPSLPPALYNNSDGNDYSSCSSMATAIRGWIDLPADSLTG